MGTFADSLFTVLMSWVRALVSAIWALFSSDSTTILEFFGKNWMIIALVIIAAGLMIDWIIWLLRWQPYHLWAQRARRILRIEDEEDEPAAPPRKAHAAQMPRKKPARPVLIAEEEALDEETYAEETPLIDEQEEDEVYRRAQSMPDAQLGAYPGMRYDSTAQAKRTPEGTQRYSTLTQEGPGAAEVARRREEIDAWQQQMQEEARARAQAEKAAREREAREAERIARERAEAEQARLAQQQYERELAEYEMKKAQYERELAEYERQKAEYDAQMAAQQAAGERRRRAARPAAYSDYVAGETVSELPDAPQWPQMDAQPVQEEAKARKGSRLLGRVAHMIEPEEEEIGLRTKLPPRVDMHEAYRPAARQDKGGRKV